MIRIHLTEEQCQDLRLRARREVGRVSERIHFVLLSDQGKSPPEIADLFGYSAASVRMWLKRYQAQGIEGLYDRPRSGRPRKANDALRNEVDKCLNTRPNALGYLATLWTVTLLVTHLASHGWQVSCSTVRRVLHALDYRWRRPKLAVMRRDPEGNIKMGLIARAIWNAQPGDHIFSVDESEFKLLPVLRAMWCKVAQACRIPTPEYNASVWVFGALDVLNGQWISGLYDSQKAVNFVAFLEKIWVACPTGHIWVIIDHAPAHTAKLVAAWLETHPRMTILYLPKYASHLNPIERIWGVMKGKVVANYCYPTLAALRRAVQKYLDSITPITALQMAGLNV